MHALPLRCVTFVILLQILPYAAAKAKWHINAPLPSSNHSRIIGRSGGSNVRILTIEEKQRLLDAHLDARHDVDPKASNMRYMTWDATLARESVKVAKDCIYQHSTIVSTKYKYVGENIFLSSRLTPEKQWFNNAVKKWDDEKKDYDYEENSCSAVCGHYTQAVWAKSSKLGCGLGLCDTIKVGSDTWEDAALLFCRYAPAGNVIGQKPYELGDSCFDCEPEETCEKNSCATAEDLKAIIEDDSYTGSANRIVIHMSLLHANVVFVYLFT